jgi:hypothetical protein
MITMPYNMTLADWADQVVLDLDRYGAFSKLEGDDWQNWGVQFLNNNNLNRYIPIPYGFDDWREWAERFCGAFI